MPKQVLNRWMPTNAAELRDAIAEILTDIAFAGDVRQDLGYRITQLGGVMR